MHVIWKRPDGFHNALPEDFRRVSLSNGAQLWLHRFELQWYPFQISGDWSGQDDTKRLNRLVNMLDAGREDWTTFLQQAADNDISSKKEGPDAVPVAAKNALQWLEKIDKSVKGDTWEAEIIHCALRDLMNIMRSFFP
jgi:hypothetical protein